MAIEFRCNQCHKLLRVDESSAGKKARCPECGHIQEVAPSSEAGGDANSIAAGAPSAFGGPASTGYAGSAPPGYTAAASGVAAPASSPPFSSAEGAPGAAGGPAAFSGGPFGAPSGTQGRNPYAEPSASSNPYAAPQGGAAPFGSVPGISEHAARAKVKPPGIVLTIVGGLMFLAGLGCLALAGVAIADGGADAEEAAAMFVVMGGGAAVAGVFPILAGVMMIRLRAHALCITGAVITIVLCMMSSCFPLAGVGVWALVVLCDTQVKAQFR